jgi:hypothetical protein
MKLLLLTSLLRCFTSLSLDLLQKNPFQPKMILYLLWGNLTLKIQLAQEVTQEVIQHQFKRISGYVYYIGIITHVVSVDLRKV